MDENRSRGSPRLQFSKEELENDALSRPIQIAEKAADKYEAAQKKLKRYRVRLTLENKENDAESSAASQESVSGDAHSAPHAGENTGIQTDPHAPAVQNTRQKPKPEKAVAAKTSASGSKPGAVQASSSASPEALHSDTAVSGTKKKALFRSGSSGSIFFQFPAMSYPQPNAPSRHLADGTSRSQGMK